MNLTEARPCHTNSGTFKPYISGGPFVNTKQVNLLIHSRPIRVKENAVSNMGFLPQRTAEGSVSSSHNTNNDNNALDRNLPTMSEVCDTPITNNHSGTNSPTQ